MASLVLSGDTSGSITLSSPAVSGSTTQTLVAVTGTLAPVVSGTSQASTSGTSIDFTSIPSWVKRITVMFSGVSTNGTSQPLFQLGSGSATTTGYISAGSRLQDSSAVSIASSTSGFVIASGAATNTLYGTIVFTNISGNIWVGQGNFANTATANYVFITAGQISLSGAIDRVRITTVNGTDTFDAGTINILYE